MISEFLATHYDIPKMNWTFKPKIIDFLMYNR